MTRAVIAEPLVSEQEVVYGRVVHYGIDCSPVILFVI